MPLTQSSPGQQSPPLLGGKHPVQVPQSPEQVSQFSLPLQIVSPQTGSVVVVVAGRLVVVVDVVVVVLDVVLLEVLVVDVLVVDVVVVRLMH